MLLEIAILGLFPAAMIYAAASDLVTMTISNRLSIALFLGFFAVAALIGMPFADMVDDQDIPEIFDRYHRSLRYWMMYRAYSKQDSQANDPKKAADALTLFEQEFGKKSSAIDETWIEREQSEQDGTF